MKKCEADLKELLKEKPAHSPERDFMSVAKSLTDVIENGARQVSQAETRLAKSISVQSDLEKKHNAHAQKLKEEHNMKIQVAQASYDKEKLRLDEEVKQERVKLEDTKKETEAAVAQARLALGNVAAVTAGSQQKMEAGQQSAGTAAAPGAVLVPTAPGFILHGNDASTEDMQQHLLSDRLWPECPQRWRQRSLSQTCDSFRREVLLLLRFKSVPSNQQERMRRPANRPHLPKKRRTIQ